MKSEIKAIFISGPYSDPDNPANIVGNVRTASEAGLMVLLRGNGKYCPVIPHTMFTMEYEQQTSWGKIMDLCIELVRRCDAILMLGGWQHSRGAKIEHDFAKQQGKTIYYKIGEIPIIR